MARPLRRITPGEQFRWDRACRAWQAGEQTIDDLMALTGMGKSYVYARLREAKFRIEDEVLDANQARHERRQPGDRSPVEPDEGLLLALSDDSRGEVRRIYDPETDTWRYRFRPHYNLATDQAIDELGQPLEGGATVLLGSRCGVDAIVGPSHRQPATHAAGQRLHPWRLRGGNRAETAGRTSHKSSKLKGGLG